ncbi:MAG: alpha/beta hydrolase [Betaproteobacteria bacterium]|nr:alpha/beta hydrolase [Betaproteobacteria bacterium]
MPVLQHGKFRIDYSDAGNGDPVVLVHSSVSGKRQWKRLAQELQPHFRVLALNLFGYGETSPWHGDATQTIADQAGLVLALLRDISGPVRIVGHSFGGSVACKAATLLGTRASHLFLFEPTLFHLLARNGCREAYAEAAALRDFVKLHGKNDHWEAVAERFIEYWIGDDGWATMPPDRRRAYMQLLRPNYYEWDCVDSDQTTLEELDRIPARSMMAYSPDARRASREIAQLFAEQCPSWSVVRIAEGGHMAPLTHPETVNPLITCFLKEVRRSSMAMLPLNESSPYPAPALSLSP